MTKLDDAIAELTRKEAERHTDWDGLHHVLVVCRNGKDEIRVRTMMAIDPAFNPDFYPVLIEAAAKEAADAGERPYAMILQIEAFGAIQPADDASPAEKLLFEAARRNRTLHELPGARESVWVWAADVHGRMWSASKNRGEDTVTTDTYAPGTPDAWGRMPKALVDSLSLHGSEYPN